MAGPDSYRDESGDLVSRHVRRKSHEGGRLSAGSEGGDWIEFIMQLPIV